MEKINIAELLKDCPKGMELDCALYDDVTLSAVSDNRDCKFPIKIAIGANRYRHLTQTGGYDIMPESKCVIFPKGKTTWEGFVPPCQFKDGDILFVEAAYDWIVIYKENENQDDLYKYVASPNYANYTYIVYDNNPLCYRKDATKIRFAAEEEKAKLFKAIKDRGYKWNSETKTLEKLIQPKFKVGDRVLYKTYGIYLRIKSMLWNEEKEQVFYRLDSKELYVASEDELQPYKEETMEEEGTLVKIDLTRKLCVADEVEVILGDYEFVLKDGKTYFSKKKPQYPKTYAECCDILGIEDGLWFTYEDMDDNHINPACISNYRRRRLDLYHNFEKLIICRDAYWKIAEDWKPDWGKGDERKYCIVNTEGNIVKWVQKTTNKILAFPTEEMRDAFYENFKELIELAKELL